METQSKTYTAEEFNEALKNTREATERKVAKQFEGYVNPNDEEYKNSMKELETFRTSKRVSEIKETHFSNFKVKNDYSGDVFKLADIDVKNDDDKTIKNKMTEFQKQPKNAIYFDTEGQQDGVQTQSNPEPQIGKQTSGGGSF